jgi:hypothetical protein
MDTLTFHRGYRDSRLLLSLFLTHAISRFICKCLIGKILLDEFRRGQNWRFVAVPLQCGWPQ